MANDYMSDFFRQNMPILSGLYDRFKSIKDNAQNVDVWKEAESIVDSVFSSTFQAVDREIGKKYYDVKKHIGPVKTSIKDIYRAIKSGSSYVAKNIPMMAKDIRDAAKSSAKFAAGKGLNDLENKVLGAYAKPTSRDSSSSPKKSSPTARAAYMPVAVAAPKPKNEDLTAKVKEFYDSMKQQYGEFEMSYDFKDYGVKGKYGKAAQQDDVKKVDVSNAEFKRPLDLENKVEDSIDQGATEAADPEYEKFCNCATYVGGLYNNRYSSRQIRRAAAKEGYQVNSYDEVLGLVAANIANGGSYERYNYNRKIAGHLGLNEFVVNAKLSGMTYSQIKESVKKATNGMNISRSTVRRLMKKHAEKQAAAKASAQQQATAQQTTPAAAPA